MEPENVVETESVVPEVDVDSLQSKLHKSNTEAKNLRQRMKQMEAELTKVKSTFSVDTIDDDWLSTVQQTLQKTNGVDDVKRKYDLDLKRAREEANQYKTQYEQMQHSLKEKSRDDKILEAISKVGIKAEAMQAARKLIASEAEYDNDSDEWSWGGESLDKYVGRWAKQNSYMLGNPVKQGATKTKSASAGEVPDGFISREEFNRMPARERIKPENRKIILASEKFWD